MNTISRFEQLRMHLLGFVYLDACLRSSPNDDSHKRLAYRGDKELGYLIRGGPTPTNRSPF